MREIKFRVWDKTNKKWLTGNLSIATDGSYVYDSNLMGDVENVDIMQFTGLHDKNGKEIYEGDIIIPEYPPYCQGVSQGEPVIVEWWECGAWYPFADDEDGMPYNKPEKCEIIGNIYENLGLLE